MGNSQKLKTKKENRKQKTEDKKMNKLHIEYVMTTKKYYLFRYVIRCGKRVKQRVYVSYDKDEILAYKEYLLKRHKGILPQQIEHKKVMEEKQKAKQKLKREKQKYIDNHTIQYDGATATIKDIYNSYYESIGLL